MNADFGNASYRPPPLPRSFYADPKPLSSAEFVHRRDQPFYENPVTFGPTVVLPATAPIPVIDSNNRINEPRILPTSLVASQIITLDSRDRDLNEYPSANQFRMILPTALRNVQCVQNRPAVQRPERQLQPRLGGRLRRLHHRPRTRPRPALLPLEPHQRQEGHQDLPLAARQARHAHHLAVEPHLGVQGRALPAAAREPRRRHLPAQQHLFAV